MDKEKGSAYLVDEYSVEPYTIQIFGLDSKNLLEKLYLPSITNNWNQLIVMMDKIKNETIKHVKTLFNAPRIMKLKEISSNLDIIITKIMEKSKSSPDPYLVRVIRYQILGFSKLLPFLLDNYIEEIYIDNLRTPIYVDHANWGRCRTKVYLSNDDIQHLITRARIEGNAPLNRANPSLKTDLVSQDFIARVSIDISPLAIDGIHIDIRKLSKQPRSMQYLVSNHTLPLLAASYLIFLLTNRCNMAIIGEPGSGKTTLMNALDLQTPRHWRKISIEDVIESVDQTDFGFHQVRFKVDPLEKERKTSTKSLEIVKLLHRSPDWVYFGEIQTEEQTNALYHALTTGLRGFFSYHATTPEHLIIRSIAHNKIPPISLQTLDTIIQLNKTWNNNKLQRRIYRISEIGNTATNSDLYNSPINIEDTFRYQPKTSQLELVADLYRTPTLERIKEEIFIEESTFYEKLQQISYNLSTSCFSELELRIES